MSLSLRTCAKVYEFAASARADIAFSSAAVRLDAADCCLTLAAVGGRFPVGGTHYATLPLHRPQAVRQWRGLDLVQAAPDGTSIQFAIGDGSSVYTWTAGAWTAGAAASAWNDLQTLQDHLPTFPVTARQMQLLVRLQTSDATRSPKLKRLVVLFDADVPSFHEELVYRTLIRQMNADLRFFSLSEAAWPGGATASYAALAPAEPPGEEAAVIAVYLATDTERRTNLLASYASDVITLGAALDAQTKVTLELSCRPAVAVSTHPDYDELPSLPCVLFDSVSEALSSDAPGHEFMVRRSDGEALAVPSPVCSNFEINFSVVAARGLDLARLGEALEAFVRARPLVTLPALDARAAMKVLAPFTANPSGGSGAAQQGTLAIRVGPVQKWLSPAQGPAQGVYGVIDANLTMGVAPPVQEAP